MKNTLMPGMIFQLSQEGRVPNQPPLFAYITDVEGNLIEAQPIDDKGQFKLKSKGDAMRGASIAIAPELPGKKTKPQPRRPTRNQGLRTNNPNRPEK